MTPQTFIAKRISGRTEPSFAHGVHATISGTPATWASVAVITTVEASGAVPPGT